MRRAAAAAAGAPHGAIAALASLGARAPVVAAAPLPIRGGQGLWQQPKIFGQQPQRRGFAEGDTKKPEEPAEADAKKPDEVKKPAAEASAKAEVQKAAGEAEEAQSEAEESPKDLLTAELKEAEEKLQKEKRELLHSLAAFENDRKAHAVQRDGRKRTATLTFAKEMIEVYDKFNEFSHEEDAVADLSDSCKALREGISMTRDIFRKTLENFDVEPLAPAPGSHMTKDKFESLGEVESEEFENNTVAEVVRPGWIFEANTPHPTVLRKAQVKLARRGPATPPPPQ